ncbi:MAG TPA: MipA/OmpV family protein [Woeseiaceae bacterium]|nr:MipA/OmpV family protein [Woeseiaceae bacterium]
MLRCRVLVLLLAAPATHAGSILDYIRNYDLNDYALGLAYSASESPYAGGERSGFAFPFLTSFRHIAFTDSWLILSGGDVGVRWVNDTGWILGAVSRIRTEGTGSTLLDEFADIDVRKWTVEAAPLVGWRGWPVHFELKWYNEIFSDYGGPTTEFKVSLPREHSRGWFVPSVTVLHNSASHNRYYYGVSESEAARIPGLDPYTPGASLNVRAGISTGYAINDQWLLSVSVNHEWLGSEITASPIVDKDSIWSGTVGIAYNNDIFRGLDYDGDSFRGTGFEFRAGVYRSRVDSTIIQRPVEGGGGRVALDVEDVLGVNRRNSVVHFEGVVRFAHFHRIEIGHFELGRDSETTLLTDVRLGDEVFSAGTRVDIDAELRVTKVAYGFSLMNDPQKELGVLAGVHVTNYQADVVAPDTGQQVETSINTPLPVIGVYGSLALGAKTDLHANLQLFRMEFDHYSGSLNNLYVGVNHYFGDSLGVGIGYNIYQMNLDSSDAYLRGSLKLRHYGPIVFAILRFR